jgi:hypothetical protein
MWLENSWICPHCRAVMTKEPVKNYDIASAISYDFPTRQDLSVVSYSWDGLHFPQAPTEEHHSDS